MSLYDKYKKDNTNNNEFNRKDGYLRVICANFTEFKLIKIIYMYITFTQFYVVLISIFEVDFTMRPVSYGFCTFRYAKNYIYIYIYFIYLLLLLLQ